MLDLTRSDRVLDIACGSGTSAFLLADQFGCAVVGVDLSSPLISRARTAANQGSLGAFLDFALGDAEALPFFDSSFGVIFSECAISTFPDKHTAAREMQRVLKPGGRLGFTDIVVANGEVPGSLPGWFSQAACMGGACSAKQYQEIFGSAGFSSWQEQACPKELLTLLRQVRMRLLALEVAGGLQKLDLSGLDLAPVKEILVELEQWIHSGMLSYSAFSAVKEV